VFLAIGSTEISDVDFTQNEDIDPVPVKARIWGTGSFASYWVSDMLAVSTFFIRSCASTMLIEI
jgi:cytosine/uracil/thiamine/allantoin permease